MLKSNAIQFSVVREDPEVEIYLFRKFGVKRPVMIGSGGCTAFTLAAKYPKIQLHLIEPNIAQIKLIQEKMKSLKTLHGQPLFQKFGVGLSDRNESSLIEQGNFESLFRGLREFLFQFVISRPALLKLLKKGPVQNWKSLFAHPYWPVAFDLYFSYKISLID